VPAIYEKTRGPTHSDIGTLLNNLATLYRAEGRYGEAELLWRLAIAIDEKALGPHHRCRERETQQSGGCSPASGIGTAQSKAMIVRANAIGTPSQIARARAHFDYAHLMWTIASGFRDNTSPGA
jgi:Tetratricopeptide repeat